MKAMFLKPKPEKPKLAEDDFSLLRLLARDGNGVIPSWSFDEQQADPCHSNFDSVLALAQLKNLLKRVDSK